jgi:hypothetical protein
MANTYTLIASSTIGSGGAANIDFTSIPSTYTDLLVKVSARDSLAEIYGGCDIRFNNDSASNYTRRNVNGNGSATGSASQTTTSINSVESVGSSATANTFSNTEIYIPNYTSSNQKSVSVDQVTENNGTTAYAKLTAGLWTGTAAINQITILPGTSFVQYTTAYLYGIKNS